MDTIIKKDLYRYGWENSLLKGLCMEGFRYTFFLRIAAACSRKSILGMFYGFIVRRLGYKYGFQIPVSTSIGEGLFIGHFGPGVVNGKAKIGKFCNLFHNITIGQANRGNRMGYPTIGDYVWIGTVAVVVGNVSIGNNVLIAPNSYVSFDVPSNSIVLGNPAKIIEKEDATDSYINYIS